MTRMISTTQRQHYDRPCQPFISSSVVASQTPVRVDLPRLSSYVYFARGPGAQGHDVLVGFSSSSFDNNTCLRLISGEPIKLDVVVGYFFYKSTGDSPTFDWYIGLSGLEAPEEWNNYSGSAGI